MKLIVQPPESKYCGHCSMAMVLNTSMEKMIAELGVNEYGASTVPMYLDYFIEKGIRFNQQDWFDNRKRMDLSGKGIICVTDRYRSWGHAMAFYDGKIYDPGGVIYESVAAMRAEYRKRVPGLYVYSITTIEEE